MNKDNMVRSRKQSGRKQSNIWANNEALEIFEALFNTSQPTNEWKPEFYQQHSPEELKELLTNNPNKFRHCKLKLERHDLGYAKPLSKPKDTIHIIGRNNIGKSFPGDEVCVEILSEEQHQEEKVLIGKVVGLMQRTEAACNVICRIEGRNQKHVKPVKNNMTRINILQQEPDMIDVRALDAQNQKWVTEEFVKIEEDQLLVVKVLKWEEDSMFPLGVVVKVISDEDYLEEIYKLHFEKKGSPPAFHTREENEGNEERRDFREVRTFTIDSRDARDLDDAFSVIDMETKYEIAIHITDVASHVSKDSEEDEFARQLGQTLYVPEEVKGVETIFMFSEDLSLECLSLVPKKERKAISLTAIVDKASNMIESADFSLSLIRSDKRLSYKQADEYIQEYCLDNRTSIDFSDYKGCVITAYRFAKELRNSRLQGSWSSGERDGRGQAQCMVEELMIFYNSEVAEKLISSNPTLALSPLRCHARPDLDAFKTKYSALLPLSPYLSHICEVAQAETEIREVKVLTDVFEEMEASARHKNYHNLVYRIISDDHPTLHHMAYEFRNCCEKAKVLRSSSTLSAKLGHFDLQLNAYTQASSPMRRYLDLVLQRLLHTVLSGYQNQNSIYSQEEIDEFCESDMEQLDGPEDYDLEELRLLIAANSSSRPVTSLAIVDVLLPEDHEVKLSLISKRVSGLSLFCRNLKLVEQPLYDDDMCSMTLKWIRRVYSFNGTNNPIIQFRTHDRVLPISVPTWTEIISAVKLEDWYTVQNCLRSAREEFERPIERLEEVTPLDDDNVDIHFKEWDLKVKLGELLQVQLGTEVVNGRMKLAVNLLNISTSYEVCLEHARKPIKCFSTALCHPTKTEYQDCEEYKRIWGKLCQVDTAYNSVEENNSVIIEDVPIEWKPSKNWGNENTDKHRRLFGSIKLELDKKKKWLLDFNFKNCFLCIRLRNQKANPEKDPCNSADLSDALPFTWVVHGIPIKSEEQGKMTKIIHTDFHIDSRSIPYIPPEDSKFTVEIIPKPITSVLREQAVANITKANGLVQNIACGNPINGSYRAQELKPLERGLGLPNLNESQRKAVQKALENSFTVIQGPPGTGKTVVGVHLTYQFHMKNKKAEAKPKRTATDEVPKKCGILYCGPSNKSVDIVAEQLMKLRKHLKPLRVHGDQIEKQEFPYAGSNIQLSLSSQRHEKAKKEIRDITLMYLVREPSNSFSCQIKAFEMETELNAEKLEKYKKVLKLARMEELRKHDVVLCTCSTAQKLVLKETMEFRQIIIDECAMATEPDALIPLVAHDPQQVVLLGDHKQLQPIVRCVRVKDFGMKTSLFERYTGRALMLDTQYRMHERICKFPSKEFYKEKLKTCVTREDSCLLDKYSRPAPTLFAHVEGEETRLAVSTADGNEKSVANRQEAEEAVRIATLLISDSGVPPEHIAILTPYNAQVCAIRESVLKMKEKCKDIKNICVCTIMKSQGSEWPYVIFSTVRTCPRSHIQSEWYPSAAWRGRRLGFITDPNQVNVAITRAQDGLCILGNQDLLRCSGLWERLLTQYQEHDCILDSSENIKVSRKSSSRGF